MEVSESNLLGDFIKEARTRRRLTLRDLAEISGISYSQLSKIERGLAKKPTEESLDNLAYALNVDKDELYALAGYISRDMQQSVAESFSTIFQKSQEQGVLDQYKHYLRRHSEVMQEAAVSYYVGESTKPDTMKEALFSVITQFDSDLTPDFVEYLATEMEALYSILKRRKGAPRNTGERKPGILGMIQKERLLSEE